MENEKSFALELLEDYKKTNKRQFIVILVILALWFATIGIFVYYINTTGYEEVETNETIDIDEVDNIENSSISIGDK